MNLTVENKNYMYHGLVQSVIHIYIYFFFMKRGVWFIEYLEGEQNIKVNN